MAIAVRRTITRYFSRRLQLGWMATLVTATPQGANRFTSSISADDWGPLFSIKRLAQQLQEPESLRAPPRQQDRPTTRSRSDEKRRRIELATEIANNYGTLPALKLPLSETCERGRILVFLASECTPAESDVDSLDSFLAKLDGLSPSSRKAQASTLANFRLASTPAYEEVLEYVLKHDAVKGMQFLVTLRADLQRVLQWMKSTKPEDERLTLMRELDAYLLKVFSLWFSPGMLDIRRITFEETSASVIEFIATKEAVHPMKSLDDLRSRLGAGRRVLALFHPLLKDVPLLFVHVALTNTAPPSSMTSVLDLALQDRPTCATFYSITNAQVGLAGIGLGEYLLKESIDLLKEELPSLDTFVTLSPMPEFRKWVKEKLNQNADNGHFFDNSILSTDDLSLLKQNGIVSADENPWRGLLRCLESADFSQSSDTRDLAVIKVVLEKLAARYIVLEKHRGKPLDGVARFHLGNGAVVHRINFGADLSRKGLQNSFGMMINYHYDLESVKDHQRDFETTFRIYASDDVLELLSTKNNGDDEGNLPQSKL